jgi:hypothetical protein
VFQNFKAKICSFLVRNDRLVRSSIVLKKQDSFRKPKTYQYPHVVTDYRLDGRGVDSRQDIILYSTASRPALGPPSRIMKLITHLLLIPRSRMVELNLHFSYFFMAWYLIN